MRRAAPGLAAATLILASCRTLPRQTANVQGGAGRTAIGGRLPGAAADAGEETATFFRSMSKEEWRKVQDTGVLESWAQRKGVDPERGFASWFRHSLKSSRPPSPYVSMTTMPHVASEYQGVVVRITVPKSAVVKGMNVWQAEYLVPGGTRVLAAEASALPLPTFAATARWAGETTVVIGGLAYGETRLALWAADSIVDEGK